MLPCFLSLHFARTLGKIKTSQQMIVKTVLIKGCQNAVKNFVTGKQRTFFIVFR